MTSNRLIIRTSIFFLVFLVIFLTVWVGVDSYRNNQDKNLSVDDRFGASLISAQSLLSGDSDLSLISETLKPIRDWSTGDLDIAAKAAICVESNFLNQDRTIFSKNSDVQLPIASLTKLMTALVVLENYNLDDAITIQPEAVNQPGEQGFLTTGESLSVNELLYIMLIESSNDAAYALAQVIGLEKFVSIMNAEALKLDMPQTKFSDPSGFGADNYSTPRDLVKLTKYLTENFPIVWKILSYQKFELTTSRGFHHELQNTNELLGQIPNIVGGKTGKTAEAKGCLLLLLKNPKNQNDLVYIILGSDQRFVEMKKMIEWANQAYIW
ncbi:MAG: serine hydrolase [Candidatus Staskawiczbacteria bacterium]|jgi:D-alanyl-D-alanine carboxypeptidase